MVTLQVTLVKLLLVKVFDLRLESACFREFFLKNMVSEGGLEPPTPGL